GGVVSIPAGELTDRFGHRWPRAAGLVLLAAGTLSLAAAGTGWGLAEVIPRLAIVGIGQGFLVGPNTSAILGALPGNVGITGGLLASSRTLALATGQAVWGGLFAVVVTAGAGVAAALEADPTGLLPGFRVAFLGAAAVATIAAVIAARDRHRPNTRS
ncbi:MAG TPA: MFS transporter, partial [Chloroflexota bacterium]|nr:MFS transporter [Chloroflexota bacterium]